MSERFFGPAGDARHPERLRRPARLREHLVRADGAARHQHLPVCAAGAGLAGARAELRASGDRELKALLGLLTLAPHRRQPAEEQLHRAKAEGEAALCVAGLVPLEPASEPDGDVRLAEVHARVREQTDGAEPEEVTRDRLAVAVHELPE